MVQVKTLLWTSYVAAIVAVVAYGPYKDDPPEKAAMVVRDWTFRQAMATVTGRRALAQTPVTCDARAVTTPTPDERAAFERRLVGYLLGADDGSRVGRDAGQSLVDDAERLGVISPAVAADVRATSRATPRLTAARKASSVAMAALRD